MKEKGTKWQRGGLELTDRGRGQKRNKKVVSERQRLETAMIGMDGISSSQFRNQSESSRHVKKHSGNPLHHPSGAKETMN